MTLIGGWMVNFRGSVSTSRNFLCCSVCSDGNVDERNKNDTGAKILALQLLGAE